MRIPVALFEDDVPTGCRDFLTPAEEVSLVERLAAIEFSAFEMRGVVVRRRVAFFVLAYDRAESPARSFPPFLDALRKRQYDLGRHRWRCHRHGPG
jgi:hypothetical protein